ncbi:MAG: hypothetical protein V1484_00565 [bacterium]
MKKPFLYAFGAVAYIVVIVLIINTFRFILPNENMLIPMLMLGLFVLSAAVMGFLFLSEPFYLYTENRKQEAVTFFGKMVGVFACFVIVFFIFLLLVGPW